MLANQPFDTLAKIRSFLTEEEDAMLNCINTQFNDMKRYPVQLIRYENTLIPLLHEFEDDGKKEHKWIRSIDKGTAAFVHRYIKSHDMTIRGIQIQFEVDDLRSHLVEYGIFHKCRICRQVATCSNLGQCANVYRQSCGLSNCTLFSVQCDICQKEYTVHDNQIERGHRFKYYKYTKHIDPYADMILYRGDENKNRAYATISQDTNFTSIRNTHRLVSAVALNRTRDVRKFIELGDDPIKVNDIPLLAIAFYNRNEEIFKLLLNNGIDIRDEMKYKFFGHQWSTVFERILSFNDIAFVKIALEYIDKVTDDELAHANNPELIELLNSHSK
jgi:hypothetical protein